MRALLAMVLVLAGCSDGPPGRGPLTTLEPDARQLTLSDAGTVADQGYLPPPADGPLPLADSGQPAPDSAAAPDTAPSLSLSADEQDLLQAVNDARAKLGLNTLVPDAQLMCAARLAAKVCPPTGSCGHVGADGSWPHDRAKSCGMSETAAWKVNEIAAGPGFTDGADAVWGWSQSSGHWWGLTHPQATRIGVSATSSGCYWAVFDCCIKGS